MSFAEYSSRASNLRTQRGRAPFISERLELLRPLITPPIKRLACKRLLDSQNLFHRETLTVKMKREDVKIALILVHCMNPFEDFSAEEEALMRGISSKTLRERKQRGRFSR